MLVMGGAGVAQAGTIIKDTLTLTEDVSSDSSYVYGVAQDTSATLDLNGHTVTSNNENAALLTNGTLTVKDSTGTGLVSGENFGAFASGDNSTLIVESGSISGKKIGVLAAGKNSQFIMNCGKVTTSSSNCWAVQIQQQASAYITGGEISGEINGLILITSGAGMTASATIEGDAVIKTTGTYDEKDKDAESHVAVFLQPENESAPVSLTVNGGTIQSDVFAISGNGNCHGTTININGGTITSNKSTAIYHPQDGTMNITGGTITGKTGIELRSGTLNIYGGSITGNGNPFEADPNGNGTTTIGSALAVSQHTTNKDIDVTISGGEFTGYYAVFESDLQDEKTDNIHMKITDGSFNGKIYSENIQNFITGGTFSDPTALHYLGEGANVQINLKADYTGETGTLNQKAFEIGANRTVSMNLGTHTFEMTKTGNTSAGNVSIANGELKLSQGLTLTGGTWDMISGSKLTIADGSSLTINGGTFVSDASVLLTADYAAQTGITDAKIVGSSGNLNLRLEKSTYTIDDYNTAKTALLNQNTENASLNFLNATLELGDGQQLVAGAIQDEDGALTLTTGPVVADANESATDAEKANKTIESVPDKYHNQAGCHCQGTAD